MSPSMDTVKDTILKMVLNADDLAFASEEHERNTHPRVYCRFCGRAQWNWEPTCKGCGAALYPEVVRCVK